MKDKIFEDLFVLELANNHWGKVERGLKIVEDFAQIVRFNNVRAAIKLQFRDVDSFIHNDFKNRQDIRYIKKTMDTKMDIKNYQILVDAIRSHNCITMATPFDEKSVDMCVKLGVQIIKIASSDLNDWILIEKIATTRKPVIVSTGGSSLKDIDDLVTFFDHRSIPLAINHCVSVYPSEKNELELNQIDFLKNRYPDHIIGFSTHERNEDIQDAIMMAYAKGARTFERHIDIDADGIAVSPYCSLPQDVDRWIKGYKKAVVACGHSAETKVVAPRKEVTYLDALVRYNKALLQRNALLKMEEEPDIELLVLWEEAMAQEGERIYAGRKAYIDEFIPIFQNFYRKISGNKELVGLNYVSHCQRGPLLEVIQRDRAKDRIMGYSLHGVHKDELEMTLDGFPIKKEGSQGQNKTFLIALKLAQFDFLKRTGSKTTPLLLLDDLFDKLDADRVEQIVKLVAGDSFGQIFITDTNRGHLDQILSRIGNDYKLFRVTDGEILEKNNI